ncbi:MAG: hypothetical protein QOI21_1584 [Actinomycetota bacterium]|nr:hypothetical protein [Actinomycetota bacterium]
MVRNSFNRGARPHVGVVAAGAVLTVVLAGCGSDSGNSAQPAPSPTTDTSPSTSSSSSDTPSPAAGNSSSTPTSPKPADGLCKAADISLSLGTGDAAAGTVYRPLVMANISDHQCTIQGFPGISYVAGADGHQVGKDAFRDGTKGDAIVLNKGDTAAADIGFVNVANYDAAQCKPTAVNGLRVYLPQETASKFLEAPGTGCAGENIPGNQLTVKTAHPGSGE